MKFILDKTYIDVKTETALLARIVEKEHDLLEQKIDGDLLYYEFNIFPTGEIKSIEFAIDNYENQTFIKGFELQKLLKPHIERISKEAE